MPHSQTTTIDTDTLMAFVFRAVDEVGAALNCALVVMGDRLGYYRALADDGPMTAAALASATGTAEPYAREWLNAQAAGAFVTYEAADGTYALPPEHVIALTDESSPAFLPGFFQIAHGTIRDADRILAAAPDGDGLGWHDHNTDVHDGCERFFRPGLQRAPRRRVDPRDRGARREAHGRGAGRRHRLRARGLDGAHGPGVPRLPVRGLRLPRGIDRHRRRAGGRRPGWPTGSTSRWRPRPSSAGRGYDLVTTFDALHDMGDPVGAAKRVHEALAPDGVWLLVEPAAGDSVEDNLNPVGRAYYGFSTLLCTPASLSQPVGAALGTQAGPARIRDVTIAAGFSSFRIAASTPFNNVSRCGRDVAGLDPAVREDADGARTASASRTPCTGPGRPPSCCCRAGRSCGRGCGRHRCRTSPGTPRGHLRRAGQRRLGPPGRCRGVRQCRVRRRHRRGHGCRRRRPRGARRALQRRRVGGPGGGRAPRAGAGRGGDRAGVRLVAAAAARWSSTTYTDPQEVTEGWAKYNRHHWLEGGYDDFVEFFFAQMFHEPHSTRQREEAAAGRTRWPRRPWSTARPVGSASTAPRPPTSGRCSGGDLPGARAPRQRGPGARGRRRGALRRGPAGHVVVLEGAGTGRRCATPSSSTTRSTGSVAGDHRRCGPPRPTRRARRAWAPGIPTARPPRRGTGRGRCGGSARCSCSRRRSVSATPGATWPSSRRCAPSTPTCGCAGWPRTR